MEYNQYIPTKLNNLVYFIFERKVATPLKVQMLPDNTVSLIFYLGDKIKSAQGKNVDSTIFNPTESFCFLTGLHTEPIYFDMEGLHSIGLNMHPSAIKAFWGIPVNEFKDAVVDWQMPNELAKIEDHIRSLKSFQERALWLENYFLNKLKTINTFHPLGLNNMMNQMVTDVLSGKRNEIDSYSGYSKMHIHRIFNDWVGLSPGKYLRYKQYLKAIDLMHTTHWNLTEIGYQCGFFDQAHFIRVFKEFANITPGNYLKLKTPLQGILPW